jgi:hypothetical protein
VGRDAFGDDSTIELEVVAGDPVRVAESSGELDSARVRDGHLGRHVCERLACAIGELHGRVCRRPLRLWIELGLNWFDTRVNQWPARVVILRCDRSRVERPITFLDRTIFHAFTHTGSRLVRALPDTDHVLRFD